MINKIIVLYCKRFVLYRTKNTILMIKRKIYKHNNIKGRLIKIFYVANFKLTGSCEENFSSLIKPSRYI